MKAILSVTLSLLLSLPTLAQRAFTLNELIQLYNCPDQACVEAFIKPRKFVLINRESDNEETSHSYRAGSVQLKTFVVLGHIQFNTGLRNVYSTFSEGIKTNIVAELKAANFEVHAKKTDEDVYRKVNGDSVWVVSVSPISYVGTTKTSTISLFRMAIPDAAKQVISDKNGPSGDIKPAKASQTGKITDATTISNLYKKIISSPEPIGRPRDVEDILRKRKVDELTALFNAIEANSNNSTFYFGILMSIQEYARYLHSYKYEFTIKLANQAEKIVRKDNKHFTMYHNSGTKKPFYTTTGWTQPEFIYPNSLDRLGVTENDVNGNTVYDFDELLTAMDKLYEQYGALTKSFDSTDEKSTKTYGDEFFSYLFNSNGIMTNDDSEIIVRNPRWNGFVEKILPTLRKHYNRAKAYYCTKQFVLALEEAQLAKEEEIKKRPNYDLESENSLIFATQTELLLQKNPQLRYGLPNKKIPTGWFIPSKLRQSRERTVVADMNQDGILDEAILLCQKEGTTFYNTNLVLHLFLGQSDGSYIVQRVVNNLVKPEYGKLKSIQLHLGSGYYASQPAGGVVAVFSEKDFDPSHVEEVCISWNKKTRRAEYSFFYNGHD